MDSSSKHFPGVQGVPPLIINGSECLINMKSDGGNIDWGFKVTIYGIISEPTADEIESYNRNKMIAENISDKSFYSLGCWILKVLLSENNHGTDQYLFQSSIINTMRLILVNNKDINIIIKIIDLLTLFFIKYPYIDSSIQVDNDLILEICLLRDFLISDIKLYEDGPEENITVVLKAKIQLVIVIEELLLNSNKSKIISSEIQDNYHKRNKINKWKSTSNISLSNNNLTIKRNSLFEDNCNYITNVTEYSYQEGEINSISIKINNIYSDISIGLCRIPLNLLNETELNSKDLENITWSCKGFMICNTIISNIDPKFVCDDVITIKIDLYKRFIQFYRNNVPINDMSIGPIGSGKYIEMNIGTGPFHLFANLYNYSDEVTIINDANTASNIVLDKNNIFSNVIPDFIKPLQDAVTLLKSILYRKLPDSIILKKFLPECVKKSKKILESNEWNGNDVINNDVIINGAQSITIVFDDISLFVDDILNVYNSNNSLIYSVKGLKSSSSSSSLIIAALEKHMDISSMDNNTEISSNDNSNNGISIGDKVVRGFIILINLFHYFTYILICVFIFL